MDTGAQICHQIRLFGDYVGGIRTAHHGKAAGGGHNGFAKGRNDGHQGHKQGLKQPDVAENQAHGEIEGGSHLREHLHRFRQQFLLEGKQVVYMMWRDDIAKIKGLAAYYPDERQQMIDHFKTADVLYIDDLFKTGRNVDGSEPKPTAADINAAFESINYRYNNPALLTIISSELNEDELLDIDEAVGGRIFERSKSFSIAKDRSKNYRIRRAVTL